MKAKKHIPPKIASVHAFAIEQAEKTGNYTQHPSLILERDHQAAWEKHLARLGRRRILLSHRIEEE